MVNNSLENSLIHSWRFDFGLQLIADLMDQLVELCHVI